MADNHLIEPNKVTIIIPTYNRARLLKRAMESVFAQTYRPLEMIIINDGGTDNTDKVIEEFRVLNDGGINLIYHKQKNHERSVARNSAIDKATGKYLCFLDDDDEFLPNKIERSVSFLSQHPDVDLVFSNAYMEENGHTVMRRSLKAEGMKDHTQDEVIKRLCKGNFIPITNVLIKTSAVKANKFNPKYSTHEDYELWLRLATKIRFDWVDEPLSLIHRHEIKVRYDMGDHILDQINILLEHISEFPQCFYEILQKLAGLKKTLLEYYPEEENMRKKADGFLSKFNGEMKRAFSDRLTHIMSNTSGSRRLISLIILHWQKNKMLA